MQNSKKGGRKATKTITRPPYALESVDNALRLLQMLRDVGALRLKDAAVELGTAPSTAHRLLSMLVYRGFAVQDEKRLYHPGPAMGVGPAERGWTKELTDLARPHMEALAILTGEAINLVIRVGSQVRFLHTAESDSMLRVGDRQGQVLPAELAAGGRILLAELPRKILAQLYLRPAGEPEVETFDPSPYRVDRRLSQEEFESFADELEAARRVAVAINLERTEEGVAAFGVLIRNGQGRPIAALTAAVPIVRYRQHVNGSLVPRLREAARAIEIDGGHIE